MMKPTMKFFLAILSILFFPNVVLAAACPTGTDTAPTAGCDISTSDTPYALTGDIAPASGVIGLQFNANADRNNLTLTGNISTTGFDADGLEFTASDNNTTTVNGNIRGHPFNRQRKCYRERETHSSQREPSDVLRQWMQKKLTSDFS